MCAVLHTSPHAVPRPRAVVAHASRSLAMLDAHSELSSRPVHPGFLPGEELLFMHHGVFVGTLNSKLMKARVAVA